MIGSAAVRHLAEAGHRVVGIGAVEPEAWARADGPFSSHFDAGRVTRVIDDDPTWALMAARSIARYPELERRSGITLHHPVGLAWLARDVDAALRNSERFGGSAEAVDPDRLFAETGIHVPQTDRQQSVWEAPPAGFINPRAMVAAQLACAETAGAAIIRQPVRSIQPGTSSIIVTHAAGSLDVDRVLMCTGPYGAELLGIDLGMERRLRTILLADIGAGAGIPSLIAQDVAPDELTGVYWVPPTQFPDGRVLLKIGGDYVDHGVAESASEIDHWFHGDGDPIEAAALEAALRELLPGAEIAELTTKPCVVTATSARSETSVRWPNIGWVDDNVAVAVGGCGASAKSGDEIGRVAAMVVSDTPLAEDDPPLEMFAPTVRSLS